MDDNLIRASLTAFANGLLAYAIQQANAKLTAAAKSQGRDSSEQIGYLLGSLWARCNRAYKRTLKR